MKRLSIKNISIITVLVFGVLLGACTGNFDDYNKHKTDPMDEDKTPTEVLGLLFPGMIDLMYTSNENRNQHIEQMVGQYGGYVATINIWDKTNFSTFNPQSNWVAYPFENVFTAFYPNYFKVLNKTGKVGVMYAWANVVRVAVMLKITDMYGPIPYSQIDGGTLAVAYDSVEDIYHTMLEELESSVDVLYAYYLENGVSEKYAQYDYVYNGDFSKWAKFANSLRLRLAVRIAAKDATYASEIMNAAIASGCIETNADNALLPTEDNPISKAVGWGDLAASSNLTAYLNAYEDPRTPAYVTMATNYSQYIGVRMGIPSINKDNYKRTTHFSMPNFNSKSSLLIYCAAETAFLKAEAALKGWIDGGDAAAKTHYENGIALSMAQHNVEIGDYLIGTGTPSATGYTDRTYSANTYAGSNYRAITVPWDDFSSSTNTKLEKIITQKWLANYPLGLEAWSEFRRTGFPQLMPSRSNESSGGYIGTIDNTVGKYVRRLPYPQSEYSGNAANVQAAVDNYLGGSDVGSVDIWWAK